MSSKNLAVALDNYDFRSSEGRALISLMDSARREAGLHYERSSLTPLSIAPLLIDGPTAQSARECMAAVNVVLRNCAALYRASGKFRALFPAFDGVSKLIVAEPPTNQLALLRVDGIVTPSGFRLVEISTGAPAGASRTGHETRIWADWAAALTGQVLTHTERPPFARDPLLFAKSMVSDFVTRSGFAPTHADLMTLPGGSVNEVDLLQRDLETLGLDVHQATPQGVVVDTQAGYAKCSNLASARNVEVVYNKFDHVAFINDPNCHLYLNAMSRASVLASPTLMAHCILDDKALLAFLSDSYADDVVESTPLADVRAALPWTRRMVPCITTVLDGSRKHLFEYALRDRRRLVLKPTNRARGLGVVIGQAVPPSYWEQAVAHAFATDGGFILQEGIPSPRTRVLYQNSSGQLTETSMFYGLDVFSFCGEFAGFMSRAAQERVVSVGGGAIRIPVLEGTRG